MDTPAAFTAMPAEAVATAPEASVTWTENAEGPAVAGFPEMAPDESRASPTGSTPLNKDHVYGAVPPDAARESEYAVPTVASFNAGRLIETDGLIVKGSW